MTDQPFSLLRNLAKAEPDESPQRTDGTSVFVDTLQSMGINSVFDILRRAKPAFVRELSSLSDADGEQAYENARCYATQIVRLYRNQLVSSGRKQALTRRTGIRSLVDIGPSFPNLFEENWDTMCKTGAIEAKDSPVAYLTSLYRFATEQLEGSADEPNRIGLNLRRPDLATLLVDQQSTFTPIPTLRIVNEVLSKSIREYVDTEGNPDKNKPIYQLIAEKQHPFQFPYNFHHQQISLGLSGKKPELGELNYRVSLETPASAPGSNLYGQVRLSAAAAQIMMSGFSPEQQQLLLEPGPPTMSSAEQLASDNPGDEDTELVTAFFKRKYAVNFVSGQPNTLDTLQVFMEKTGLTAKDVESLLAIRNDAPYQSQNVAGAGGNATDLLDSPRDPRVTTGANYGATYVNGPSAANPMGIEIVVVNNRPASKLTHTTVDRYDRLQRMIRLQRWMSIPFSELDTLVTGLIRSEGAANTTQTLSLNTLRGLGVFRYLNKRYALEPEELAAFVYRLAPFGSGGRLPMFDNVFNSPVLFDNPLKLDGTTLYLEQGHQAITKICAALRLMLTLDSFVLLASDTRALIDDTEVSFALKLRMVSSVYRQARIATLFGLNAKDSWGLIDLQGGLTYRKKIVTGKLTAHSDEPGTSTEPDILDILMQLDWAVTWLEETGRDVATLRRQLGIDPTESDASQDILDQLNQLAKEAREAALTESQLANLNLPDDSNGEPVAWWSSVLAPLINANGLVITPTLRLIDDVAADLAVLINQQLEGITLSDEIKAEVSTKLLEFVLKGYLAQHRLVEGLLQSVAGLPLNRCEGVVRWAGSRADEFLSQALAATAEADIELPLSSAAKAVIDRLTAFIRHAEISQQLGLSAQALRTFLVNPKWLHSAFVDPLTLSLSSLFLLDRYAQWRDNAGQPEQVLLGYFSLANTTSPPAEHSKLCATVLATLTGWSATEIEIAASLFPADKKFATCVQQTDWIRRVHSTSQKTGLNAESILGATNLTHASPAAQWQSVGEAVMAASVE